MTEDVVAIILEGEEQEDKKLNITFPN